MTKRFVLARRAAIALILAMAGGAADAKDSPRTLERLFADWRKFEPPAVRDCAPDYGAAAIAEKAKGLADFQKKLAAIDSEGWPTEQRNDLKLVAAEMNGMDFNLRVLKPWARDPAFYASVRAEVSDVPEYEGPSIHPVIALETYEYPLSKSDQKELTCLLGAVPGLLDRAKVNLKESNARDLWVHSTRAFKGQSAILAALAAGTLEMRTLDGTVRAELTGADPALIAAVDEARAASDAFIAWIEQEAPSKTGPSGVGEENYDWLMKNVLLSPYGWAEQVTLLRRELERARASLALEEFSNRDLPPLESVDDPEAWTKMANAKMAALTEFLIENELVEDAPFNRAALASKTGVYTPPEERNFFSHGMAFDPSPLYAHMYHWVELARRAHAPTGNKIRAATPVFDMYSGRSEGLATAMEELLMQAGLYDDAPRGREIVWIMLANRAARGLASLYVQSNEMTLEEAGKFHARWTPREWSDPASDLVAFEQLLYLAQPGYGTSYITGKLELDRLISDYAFAQEQKGEAFSLPGFFRAMNESGIVPFALIEAEMVTAPLAIAPAAADGKSPE